MGLRRGGEAAPKIHPRAVPSPKGLEWPNRGSRGSPRFSAFFCWQVELVKAENPGKSELGELGGCRGGGGGGWSMGMSNPCDAAEQINKGRNTQTGLSPPCWAPGICPNPGGTHSISELHGTSRWPWDGDQFAMCHWSQRAFNPPLSRPAFPRRLQSSSDRQEFVAMCWEKLLPTSCRQPDALGMGVRGCGGPNVGRGPAAAPPCAGMVLPGLCPGQRMENW